MSGFSQQQNRLGLACSLFMLGMMSAALADDVTDQLDQAKTAYENKDFSSASAALDLAMTLIRQMNADVWRTMLPEPLTGWEAEDAASTAVAPAMFGGGTSVSRQYRRNDDTVDITLLMGSPILQGMGALLSGGMMASSDMKLSIINGRKMTYTKSENSYQTMVANKVLVKVEGSKGVDDTALRAYIAAIKFQKIEKAGQ